MSNKKSNSTEWSNRFGFIFAALGMAVGTGNIWRFPRVVGQNYGGTFVIAYIICNFLWALPLIIAEMGIGKSTRKGTIGAFRDFVGEKYSWMGTFITWVCAAITFYYAVIFAQALRYFVYALQGKLTPGMDAQGLWDSFVGNPIETVSFTIIAALLTGFVIYKGVKGGLEKLGKVAVPILFISLLGVGLWSFTQPRAIEGMRYLFVPDFNHIFDLNVWLSALAQSAWSAGAGWGLVLTYANYFKKDEDIVGNASIITFGDMTGAILGAFAVLPAVFALANTNSEALASLEAGNIGLTFITLASYFPTLPGGQIIAILFFGALSLSALTSIVPQAEVVTRNLENLGFQRKNAAIVFTIATIIFATPSALYEEFLANQDWVYSIGLLFCGLFFAIAVYKYGVENFRKDIVNPDSDFKINKYFNFTIKLFPVLLTIILGYNVIDVYMSNPDGFFDIFSPLSFGTVIVQLGLVLLISIVLNRTFSENIEGKRYMTEGEFIG